MASFWDRFKDAPTPKEEDPWAQFQDADPAVPVKPALLGQPLGPEAVGLGETQPVSVPAPEPPKPQAPDLENETLPDPSLPTGMARVSSKSGAPFTVGSQYTTRFQGFLDDLEDSGYDVDASQSSSYNQRNIRNTNTPSKHASGRAIDVNSLRNAEGGMGDILPDLARALSQKHGLKWGGDFKGRSPDPMHFEIDDDWVAPVAASVSDSDPWAQFKDADDSGLDVGPDVAKPSADPWAQFKDAEPTKSVPAKDKESPYSLSQGFIGSLVGTNPKLVGDAAEGFGVMLDSPGLQDVGKKIAGFGEEQLKGYESRVPSFTDVRTDSFGNFLSDVGAYGGYQMGSALGTSAPSLVVGGAAALATANPWVGLAMGAAGPSYIQNFGDVYGSARDEPGIKARVEKGELTPKQLANTAAIAAVPIAALDLIGLQAIMGKAVFGPAKKTLIRDILHGIATGAIAEGSTEGLQQIVSEWAQTHLGSQKPLYNQFVEVVDNFIAGTLGGAAIGGGGAGIAYPAQAKELQEGAAKGRALGFPPQEGETVPPLMQAARALAPAEPPSAGLAPVMGAPQAEAPPEIPSTSGLPPASPDEISILKGQGWSDDAISEMGLEERAKEIADALEQGPSPLASGGQTALAEDRPSAEPIVDLRAQALDLADPANPRQAVWIPRESYDALRKDRQALKDVVGSGVRVADFDGQGGVLVARDEKIAAAARKRRDAGESLQAVIGELTGAGVGKPAGGTAVVQQLTPEGGVARESVVTPETRATTEQAFAVPGREVRTVAPGEALQRRQDLIQAEGVPVAGSVTAPEPSEAQRQAGNYAKRKVSFQGLPISIETEKGADRVGKDKDGEEWRVTMPAAYGYVRRSEGKDGDQVDVFVGDSPDSDRVFVVDQLNLETGKFDEHKAVLGTKSETEARSIYTKAYSDGKGAERIGDVTAMSVSEFKEWLAKGKRTKPAGEITKPTEAAPEIHAEKERTEPIKTTPETVAGKEEKAAEKPAEKAANQNVSPDAARGLVSAPSYDDLIEHVGEDEDGLPDVAALQDLLRNRFGKVAWADLTDGEKISAWEDVTGEDFDPALFQDVGLSEREAAARAEMDTDEWRKASTVTQENDTSKQPGYGSPEWRDARRYVSADGSDIEGTDDAVDYLIDRAREAVPGGIAQDGRAFIIMGYPGAGKSVIADILRESFQAAHMTADDAKLIIPEYDEGRNAQGVHLESAHLIALAVDNMIDERDNIIIETVGSNRSAVDDRARLLREKGYHPALVFIDVPKAIAMERAVSRFKETGRPIPASLYETLKPGETYENAKASQFFDDVARVAWDEEAGSWRVAEATDGLAGISADLEQASLREPAMGRRDRNEGPADDVEDVDEFGDERQSVAGAKPKATAKPKRIVSPTTRLNALAKKLVGQDRAAWVKAQPELEKLMAEVEAKTGETATTKSTRASLQKLGLIKGPKIEDAGEKIGGARKDKWAGRGLDISDLEGMTGAEMAEKVSKTAIFPRPDYTALVEDGMEPKAAYLIKAMYDRVPVKPGVAYVSLPDVARPGYVKGSHYQSSKATPQSYITALQTLRDIIADVETVDRAREVSRSFHGAVEAMTGVDARLITTSIYKASGRYRLKNPLAISWADERKAEKAISEGWPGNIEPWQKKFRVGQSYKGDWIVVAAGKKSHTLYAADLESKEEAVAKAKELYEAGKGETKSGEPKRPHLDKLERSGPDYREGKNVGSEDFVTTFGFRGVEFGNWVAGDERQKTVNLGFDALHDLGRALGIPAKAISLDGTLALAFGARGQGGKAAAHYEPGRLVVNMTKLSGAGSLAHEWGHALDHYLGEAHTDKPYGGSPRSASGWYAVYAKHGSAMTGPIKRFAPEVEAMPPRLKAAVKGLMNTIFYASESDEAVVERATKALKSAETGLKSWIDHRASLKKRLSDVFSGDNRRSTNTQIRKADEAIVYWQRRLDSQKSNLKAVRRAQVESQYFKAAKTLSGKTGAKGYWARPTELFARSFEAFVFDTLGSREHMSQYLVQGVEPDRYANKETYKANPYPTGDERRSINQRYARLMKAIGGVAGKLGSDSKLVGLAGEAELEPEGSLSETVDVEALTSTQKLDQLKTEMGALEDASEKAATPLERIRDRLLDEGFATIVQARAFAKEVGFEGSVKEIDELVERAAVAAARSIVAGNEDPKATYTALVDLYARQPKLTQRTSESVSNQAYSTPVPLAYIASRLAGVADAKSVYEPTAGNGALLIETDPAEQTVHANELDAARAKALKDQGFKTSTLDAVEPMGFTTKVDTVIANPPFGAVREGGTSKVFKVGDFSTTSIDHAIALTSLNEMKDDGKAVLLLGGVKADTIEDLRKGYRSEAKRLFYHKLYNTYNVVDHFTIDGGLYEKQGAGWPVDVVVINGRRTDKALPLARALPAAEPPAIYKAWADLGEKLDAGSNRQAASGALETTGGAPGGGGRSTSGNGAGVGTSTGGGRGGRAPMGDDAEGVRTGGDRGQSADATTSGGDRSQRGAALPLRDSGRAGDVSHPVVGEPGLGRQANAAGQSAYQSQSKIANVGSLVPVNMASSTRAALARVEAKRGPVDDFVAEQLDYKPGTLVKHFSAEQVDALALAIDNVQKGAAVILGDQTGLGKGRAVAGMLRYAILHDMVPVMFTKEPKLYGDMFRDMNDIGLPEMLGREPRVLMTNAGESVPLDEAALEYKAAYDAWASARDAAKQVGATFTVKQPKRTGKFLTLSKAKVDAGMKAMLQGGTALPYDMVFTTYDQMNTVRKADTERRKFIDAIAPRSMLVLDEAHEAGGAPAGNRGKSKKKVSEDGAPALALEPVNRAEFTRGLVSKAKAVMYSSATYAKRPDVMDLYARTDMGLAVDDPKLLPDLISKGGVPLQQVVATMLSEAGQYVRRERSFEGVSYEVEGVPVNNAAYEQFSDSVRQIFEFDLAVSEFRKKFMENALDAVGGVKSSDAGVGEAAANSTAFASIMHNIVGQMLLSIKAEPVAEMAIKAWKAGEKPLIGLSNTMESFVHDFARGEDLKAGDVIDLNFGDVLARYLARTLRITVKHPDDTKEHIEIPVEQMPGHLQDLYLSALDAIRSGNYEGMPVSPIDWIRHKLTAAGMSVMELTGRQMMIDYSGGKQPGLPGMRAQPRLSARPKREMGATGKSVSISAFNAGKLDALILNRSGSTGVSMHASKTFKDQRPRRMLLVQAEPNIDTHMQLLGRIHRTGQVVLPRYSQLVADIPAEARPTAVLMKKMASLNANTTASRKSVFMADAVDFINAYGDRVVAELLIEEPTLNRRLGNPVKVDLASGKVEIEGAARKATGRLVLLPPAEQADFLDRVQTAYKEEVERLDQLGENVLEARSVDLQARPIDSTILKARAGEGPFLGPVTMEKVSAKAQGRAMAPISVAKAVAESLNEGVSGEDAGQSLRALDAKGRDWARAKAHDMQGRFADWIDIGLATTETDKRDVTRRSLEQILQRWRMTMAVAYPGASVRLTGLPVGDMDGIVTKVARPGKAKNPAALGAWQVTIAVPDASRQFVLPMSMLYPPEITKSEDEKGAEISRSYDSLEDILPRFEEARKEGRESRYVVTGNILAGYDSVRGKGQIVNYTTDTGETKPGVLMPRDFSMTKYMKERAVRLITGLAVAKFLERAPRAEVISSDKLVKIVAYGPGYQVTLPAGRGTGGRYYTEPSVRDAIAPEQFTKSGNVMRVIVSDRGKLIRMVDAMHKLGALFETTQEQDIAAEITETVASRRRSFLKGSRRDAVLTALKMGKAVTLKAEAEAALEVLRRGAPIVPAQVREVVVERIEPYTKADFKVTARDVNGETLEFYDTAEGLRGTSALFDVLPDGTPYLALFAFETGGVFDQRLEGGRAHEGVHALRELGLLPGKAREKASAWGRLVGHADLLGMLAQSTRAFAEKLGHPNAAEASEIITLYENYRDIHRGRRNVREIMDQESVAAMVQLYVHGQLSEQDVAPVKDLIEAILSGETARGTPVVEDANPRVQEFVGALEGAPRRSYMATAGGRELDQRGLYSPSLEAAKRIPQEKGTVEQMRAMLLTAGAAAKELEAVGFDQAFPDPQAKVSRAEIEQFLRENRVGLGEKTFQNFERTSEGVVEYFDEAERQAFENAGLADQTRFETYSTPGGIPGSYREVVVTLPRTGDRSLDFFAREEYGAPLAELNQLQQSQVRQMYEARVPFKGDYTSTHWPGITNPLLHYRVKDFGAANDKTRVLDELQSDWAQRARDQGTRDPGALADLRERESQLHNEAQGLRDQMRAFVNQHGTQKYVDALMTLDPELVVTSMRGTFDGKIGATARELYEAHGKAREQYMDVANKVRAAELGVPSAPYISSTSDWVDLGLKQVLMDAAKDPSVSRLAWPPGPVHVSRYPGQANPEGQSGFYGDFAKDGSYIPGIVGTRLLKLVKALDPQAAKIEPIPSYVDPMARRLQDWQAQAADAPWEKPSTFQTMEGYPSIPITPKLREKLLQGLPMFGAADKKLGSVIPQGKARAELQEGLQDAINSALSIVARIAGRGVTVELRDTIPTSEILSERQMAEVEGVVGRVSPTAGGFYRPGILSASDLIGLATNDPVFDLKTAAGHEAFHHVKEALATPAEKRLLDAPSERTRMRRLAATEIGMAKDDPRLEKLDPREIEAYAFQRYRRLAEEGAGSASGLHIAIRKLFDRIIQVLRAVRNALNGLGYATYEDVFERARTGEIAARAEAAMPQGIERDQVLASVIPRGVTNAQFGGTLGRRVSAILRRADPLRVKIQDKMLPVRRIIEAQRAAGIDVPIAMDTYVAEAIFHGRAGERVENLNRDYIEPLTEGMRLADIGLEQFDEYLYARHAPERNAAIAQIDPTNLEGSGMSDTEAQAIMDRIATSGKQGEYDALAKIVDEMIAEALSVRVAAGLMTSEDRDAWRAKYGSYVPLRGFEVSDEEGDPDRPRSGRGFQVSGPESKRALGRRTRADSPVSYAVMQAMEAIIRSEKNRVFKTLYRNVEANPDPSMWNIYKGEFAKRFNPSTGLVERKWRTPQTFMGSDNDLLSGKIGGKTVYIEIKHRGLLRAMKGVGAETQGAIINAMMRIMRIYAQLLTSWNPEFTIPNFFRDMQTALGNISDVADKPADIRRQIVKEAFSLKSIRGILSALRGGGQHEYAAWFEEYRLAGGKISFMEYNDVQRIKKRIVSSLNDGDTTRAMKSAFTLIEDINTAVENGVRLSSYIALRRAGFAKDRAAFIARELTVNFNRKGEWGAAINSMYLFFNASAQGSVRLAQAVYRSKALRYALGGLFVSAMVLDWWNALLAGDDDDGENYYDQIPDWIKERNIVIVTGSKKEDYVTIPLAYGYNVPYLAGQQLGSVLRGKKKPLTAAANVASGAMESFNPLGSAVSFWQYVSPTILDPGVQMLENKTWYGGPIYPTKFDKRQPDSELHWNTTPWYWKEAARIMNEGTGGNVGRPGYFDVSPETIQHYVEFVGGGLGKFAANAIQTGQQLFSGEEWIPEKTPLMRRFYGKATTVSKRRQFYEAWDEVDAAVYEINKLKKNDQHEEAKQAMARYPAQVKVHGLFKGTQKSLKNLRDQRDKITANETMSVPDKRLRIEAIIERENAIVQKAIDAYHAAVREQTERKPVAFPEPMRLGGPLPGEGSRERTPMPWERENDRQLRNLQLNNKYFQPPPIPQNASETEKMESLDWMRWMYENGYTDWDVMDEIYRRREPKL